MKDATRYVPSTSIALDFNIKQRYGRIFQMESCGQFYKETMIYINNMYELLFFPPIICRIFQQENHFASFYSAVS